MKQRQHLKVTLAVLKYYDLPPEYAAYSIWPDYVPKSAVLWTERGGAPYPIPVKEPHHQISRGSFIEEFLMNVSDYKRDTADDRKGALANTVKLMHYVQDGCVLHRCEDSVALVPLDVRWVEEGEGLVSKLPRSARERAGVLHGEIYARVGDREALRAAAALSSALMGAFMDSVGLPRRALRV